MHRMRPSMRTAARDSVRGELGRGNLACRAVHTAHARTTRPIFGCRPAATDGRGRAHGTGQLEMHSQAHDKHSTCTRISAATAATQEASSL